MVASNEPKTLSVCLCAFTTISSVCMCVDNSRHPSYHSPTTTIIYRHLNLKLRQGQSQHPYITLQLSFLSLVYTHTHIYMYIYGWHLLAWVSSLRPLNYDPLLHAFQPIHETNRACCRHGCHHHHPAVWLWLWTMTFMIPLWTPLLCHGGGKTWKNSLSRLGLSLR